MEKRDDTSNGQGSALDRAKLRPRHGWLEAFGDLVELTDEESAWLEFDNQGDENVGEIARNLRRIAVGYFRNYVAVSPSAWKRIDRAKPHLCLATPFPFSFPRRSVAGPWLSPGRRP